VYAWSKDIAAHLFETVAEMEEHRGKGSVKEEGIDSAKENCFITYQNFEQRELIKSLYSSLQTIAGSREGSV
jgi:hypothetical protein